MRALSCRWKCKIVFVEGGTGRERGGGAEGGGGVSSTAHEQKN